VYARPGDKHASIKLKNNTEYYILADDILIDHFNTNAQINKYFYGDEAGETLERIIARINGMQIDATLTIQVAEKPNPTDDLFAFYATTNNDPDKSDLYVQNINGKLTARAINPDKKLIVSNDAKFQIGFGEGYRYYDLEKSNTKTARQIADEINALNANAYEVYFGLPLHSYAELLILYQHEEKVRQLFDWSLHFHALFIDSHDSYEKGTLSKNDMSWVMLVVDHEIAAIEKLNIKTKEEYQSHIKVFRSKRQTPTKQTKGEGMGVSRTRAFLRPHGYGTEGYVNVVNLHANPPNGTHDNIPTQLVVPPSFATEQGMCMSIVGSVEGQVGSAAEAACVIPDRYAPNGYEDRERTREWLGQTYIPAGETWQHMLNEGMRRGLHGQLEAMNRDFDTTHFFATFTLDEFNQNTRRTQIDRAREHVTRWAREYDAAVARLQNQINAQPRHQPTQEQYQQMRLLRQGQQSAKILITWLSDEQYFTARTQGENALQLVWDRATGDLAGITTLEMGTNVNQPDEFVIEHTLVSPTHAQSPQGQRLTNLGTLVTYSAIKRIKNSRATVTINGKKVDVNKVNIVSDAVTINSAGINRKLGFIPRQKMS
jgi:hypothetical protein